jgi:hypothetical protein
MKAEILVKKRTELEKRKYKELVFVLQRALQKKKAAIERIISMEYPNRKWLKTSELLKLLPIPAIRITQMRKFGIIEGLLQSGAYYYTVESLKTMLNDY